MTIKLFAGPEVENRLEGVITLFVVEKVSNFVDYARGFNHVYFQPGYLKKNGYADVELLLEFPEHWIITIEVYPDMVHDIPGNVMAKAHIVLAVILPEIAHIKHTDTVRLDFGHQKNFSATRRLFKLTTPEEYTNDWTVLEE